MTRKIKIYGSDTNILLNGNTVRYPLLADILALPDVVDYELDVKGVYAQLDVQTEKKSFWNLSELHINTVRNAYNPQSIPKKFPTTATTIEAFFGSTAISKRFKWIDIQDYNLRPSALPLLSVIAINITGVTTSDNGDGTKSLAFNIVERGI